MIYLDHAATTQVDPAVFDAMLPFFSEKFGNPSSVHAFGQTARAAVDSARGSIAKILNCSPREIVFTSGATESNNLSIRGHILARQRSGCATNHIITTAIEHHAVLEVVEDLSRDGIEFTVVPVGADGIVQPQDVEAAIRPDTSLISVMYANNEIGAIQPIAQISEIARQRGILFHTDAVQAANYLSLDVNALGIDLLSLSAHKLYAPKGVGLLYVRSGTDLSWLQVGGGQEYARRAGTENVPGIVGLAAGLQAASQFQIERAKHAKYLRDRIIENVLERVPESQLNGHPDERLPNNAHLSFAGVDGESLLMDLDLNGIAVSSGSACASGSNQPSHVLLALGLSTQLAEGSLRITVGKDNTVDEVDRAIDAIISAVSRIRMVSNSLI